jgi:hypothetical protein
MKYLVFIGLVINGLMFGCNSAKQTLEESIKITNKSGKELANIYCASCHVFAEPQFLPKDIWLNNVLPKMGHRLGHGDYLPEMLALPSDEMMKIMASGIYPDGPLIAKEDWEKIIKYYIDNAPEKLVENKKNKTTELIGFEIKNLKINDKEIVMTQYDSLQNNFYVGTANPNKTYKLNTKGGLIDSTINQSPILTIKNHSQLGKLSLAVGKLNPSDLAMGSLTAENKTLIKKMQRPVNMILADINNDNYDDFIIANFGNLFGNLTWYEGKTFKENVLINDPGARVIYYLDFDKDGKKDILVLMTQAKESILFFKNLNNKGEFDMQTLFSFPPYYGSSFFDIKDIDNDNDLDIIYTNGDNADLSIVKKFYHGVRIFENNGKNNFTEKYFYPINGASKVVLEDFDNDKDLDMAVISYFPDEKNNEGFLYFENTGMLTFEVKSKKNISNSKWLTIDSGDFDKDGDKDIILGAFNRGIKNNAKNKTVLILENKRKK